MCKLWQLHNISPRCLFQGAYPSSPSQRAAHALHVFSPSITFYTSYPVTSHLLNNRLYVLGKSEQGAALHRVPLGSHCYKYVRSFLPQSLATVFFLKLQQQHDSVTWETGSGEERMLINEGGKVKRVRHKKKKGTVKQNIWKDKDDAFVFSLTVSDSTVSDPDSRGYQKRFKSPWRKCNRRQKMYNGTRCIWSRQQSTVKRELLLYCRLLLL